MLRHYLEIKERYPEELLFYRVGDFYEMFYEDAVRASKLLDIALTSRDKQNPDPVPLCGVPHHAVNGYISRLIEQGHKVVVCDQVEDARHAQGLVRREVTRVITPGTLLEDEHLDARGNNFLLGLAAAEGRIGLAHLDLSTGEFRAADVEDEASAVEEVARIDPREVLLAEDLASRPGFGERWRVLDGRCVNVLDAARFDRDRAEALLCDQFGVGTLEGFGCGALDPALGAAGALVAYARATQMTAVGNLRRLVPYTLADYMVLDEATRRNLELTETLLERRREGSLLGTIDRTVTAMGSRTLRRWILYPLLRPQEIERRLDAVGELLEGAAARGSLRKRLRDLADLERINARIAAGRATPRDLVALKDSLERAPAIEEAVSTLSAEFFRKDRFQLDPLPDVAALIGRSLVDDPPFHMREGGVVRPGYHARLDELRDLSSHGKGWIAELEARERQRTGIGNLKIRFNKVFGYTIEVTKTNLARVPPDYERRQTLVNAERFVTPDLKVWESKVLGADEEAVTLEREVFEEILTRVRSESDRIQKTAAALARLDVVAALAQTANDHRRCRFPAAHDSHRTEHGGKIHRASPDGAHRAVGADGELRPGQVRPDRRGGPHLHPRGRRRQSLARPEHVHGGDDRGGEHPAPRIAAEPLGARRDRARDLHLRRDQHRLGHRRVPSRPIEGPDPVRHPLPRADGSRPDEAACAQLPHRGEGVERARDLPAPAQGGGDQPQLRDRGRAARRASRRRDWTGPRGAGKPGGRRAGRVGRAPAGGGGGPRDKGCGAQPARPVPGPGGSGRGRCGAGCGTPGPDPGSPPRRRSRHPHAPRGPQSPAPAQVGAPAG
jgi:hypothetical protein